MASLLTMARNLVPFTRYPYRGGDIACDLCGADERIVIAEHDRRLKCLRTVVCAGCGLLRTDPMPTEAELADYYAGAYRLDYQFAGDKPPRFHLKRSRDEAARRLAYLAPVLKPGARVLDFGAGSGEFLAAAQAAGHQVTGIEPGEVYARYARETHGVEVINAPWTEADLPDGHFDLITTNHVVEHLRTPVAALRQLARWLKDDGVLFIAVPDLRPRKKKRTFELFHFAHIYGFTPATLELAAAKAGLEPDPRIPPLGTMYVLRKRAGDAPSSGDPSSAGPSSAGPRPDPDYARTLAASFRRDNPYLHLFAGGWLVDAARRLRKDLRDTFAKNQGRPKK